MALPHQISFLLIFLFCFVHYPHLQSKQSTEFTVNKTQGAQVVIVLDNDFYDDELNHKYPPEFVSKIFKFRNVKNKKLIAALFSFPFPFGIVGLHRIYLGTSPHVPLVYIGTLGGGFGLIPLIDFFAILFVKDLDSFIDNNKVFMWIK